MVKKAIKVRNLCKTLGKKKILENINFDIYEGEIVGIIGRNCSCRSTLLKVMMGIYKIDKGDIFYYGVSLRNNFEEAMSNICTLAEMPHINKKANENNKIDLFKSMFKNIDEIRLNEIYKIFEMENHLGKKYKTYPAYIQKRLDKVTYEDNKKILILDNPIDGLEPYGISKLIKKLKSLKNTTILVSSNKLGDLDNFCDKIIFLNDGKIDNIKVNARKDRKDVIFEVDDYSKARLLLNDYCINEELEVYETDEKISDLNRELIFNNINVYRIYENNFKFNKLSK